MSDRNARRQQRRTEHTWSFEGPTVPVLACASVADPVDDIALLYAWREGDRDAGDALLRMYYPQVLGFFRLRAEDVAEDLTQRTFMVCMEARSRVTGPSFRGYLFGAAKNVLYKHLRSSTRRARRTSAALVLPQSELTPGTMIAMREEHYLLLQALQRLNLEQQVLVALHYVQCLRAREIAEAMDLTVSAVTTRLARARQALKNEVDALVSNHTMRESLTSDLEQWGRSLGPLLQAQSA